ncbi:Mycothiol acetyltransferase [Pseudovibrio axinellae]|uniref:Mycothiol acetyltransferase n=1 Tax=Pseudovibrio axinellae TaxID=989403 RepID=A0A161X9R5_9HYPH|nr:N-acetyltransferase [Pseudovibrio axinellae]KZL09438.1 Mycothiol acetyltransferase [Pseudovibrio axinellae]SEQ64893.1 ribosomal-protein-alanine N-acetyltransferase [Pseudovibrio axinellae]
MKTFEIHSARSKDIPQIGTVGLASWERGIAPHVPQAAHDTMNETSFKDFASACLDQIVVAVNKERVLGFIATENSDNFITDLWIDPECESKGLGSALVSETERRIAARGYNTAEISVLAQNERALSLYHHMGYEEVERAKKFHEKLNCEISYIKLRKHLPFYAEEIA